MSAADVVVFEQRKLEWLTAKTHACLDLLGDNFEQLPELIAEMRESCPWTAEAWGSHCEQFRPAMERISRSMKIELEHALRASGFSYRQIAAVTGTTGSQVLRNATVAQPEKVTGADGRRRPAKKAVTDALLKVRRDLVAAASAEGKSGSEIAAELDVSHATVKNDLALLNKGQWRKARKAFDGRIDQVRETAQALSGWRVDFPKVDAAKRWECINALTAVIRNSETLISLLDVNDELDMTHHHHDYKGSVLT